MNSAHGAPPTTDAVNWWSTDTSSVAGTVILIALASAFVIAARRRSRSGRTWPRCRTWSYVGGCGVVAVTLFSGIAHYDDLFAVHVGQHLVLMMVAPILLVYGGPLRLLTRALPQRTRSEVTAVLADPLVRRFTAGRRAVFWLCADYYGAMAVYLLTPIYRWSTEHQWLHISAHMYFLLCGLLFWIPLIGEDPIGRRTPWPTQRVMLTMGVPFYIALGTAVALLPTVSALPGAAAAGTVLALGGGALSVAGLTVLWLRAHRGTVGLAGTRPDAIEGAGSWPAAC
ncbi:MULTISPECIES: cytochrome c oxidase assembly protein [unclassified Rhodococcus (in: high G+C Gram-positive bacteria)]|uniref:cytochrome c oxidase assembly protein n=1 Tax=unclassified Rhodococcus (in: high G+C Gram-positive bacteria) TaxID=192944 RepID=UPI00163A6EEB|nr:MULTISPECIES: cytochrome c oxidase assembly protein [unclassified Rhodococcus (in: high G+C Gram-positive bacteria)]MBC2644692.1 cytochrome c oxidase assembly protein [Rhodococcus sp. 3A]MBC2898291.1 cytochrome c oxidase assembly protein [Rhodococcus sp. 4CII]